MYSVRDDIEQAKLLREIREASDDDHPYGPWSGGSKAQGGHPGGGGGPSSAAQIDPTNPRDRWANIDDIQKEMGERYPGTDWSDLSKLSLTDANDLADTIDGVSTRFGPPPNFRGVKVSGPNGGVLAEVKRDVPGVKGSSVYVYGMDTWSSKAGGEKHFVGGASKSLRQSKRATVTHEMGHTYLGLNLHSRFGKDRNDPQRQATEKWVNQKFLPNYKTAHVSKYARKNEHEAWAEVFTAAVSPSLRAKNQSHFPGELASILDNDFPVKFSEASAEISEAGASTSMAPPSSTRADIAVALAQFGHICGFAAAHPEFPLDPEVGLDDFD
jgi:hypothetical protein